MFQKNEINTDNGSRFCRKCGCELMSTNKRNLCANCRREKGKGIRNVIITGATVVTSVFALGWLNSQSGEDVDGNMPADNDNDDYDV